MVDPADPPRDLSGWAWGSFVCLGLMALLSVARLVAALDLRSTATGGGDVIGSYETYSRWVNFHTVLLLITAAVFITWFFQAYKNLRRLGLQNMRYGNGWAIGSWFVPILGLVRPKQIANDVWRGSERGAEVSTGWRMVPVPSLLHWWWGLFLLQGALLYVGERTAESGYNDLFAFGLLDSGITQIKTGTTFDVLGELFSIAGAVLAILVVSRVTERFAEIREEALARAPQVQQYTQPQYGHPQPAQPQYAQAPPYHAPAVPLAPTSTPTPTQAPTEQRIQCPDCAEWIQPQANVCRFCGHRLRPLGQ